MKRLLYFLLGVVTVFIGLSFAYKNSDVVALNYYFGLHWESPLSLMLLATLAIGIVLGFVASLGMVVRMQRQLVRARREIREIEQEVMNLRALPIKDVL
ncbi:MAG: LapA family protein [Acidiferrobacterales bacterium]